MNADETNIWGRAWQIEHLVELHSSGLIETANHSSMQKTRIIGFFFFENSLHRQFVEEKNYINGCFRRHVYLHTNKILIHNFLCIYKWGKIKP